MKFHIRRRLGKLLWVYIVTIVLVSLVGSFFGLRGKKTPITRVPTGAYQNVSFVSQAPDKLTLEGWYFPANSKQVAVIAHGWGGNRETFLDLAQYLQKNNISVLTFDLRGGTGRNTYGQLESQDIASAIAWLKNVKKVEASTITLLGNSMGGAASINYAASEDIGKLVLISSVVNLSRTKTMIISELNLIFPSVYAFGVTLTERVLYGVMPVNPITIFNQINEPTFVLHGISDVKTPIKDVYTLQEQAKNRNQAVKFMLIPQAGHNIFKDLSAPQKEALYQKILEFITSEQQ